MTVTGATAAALCRQHLGAGRLHADQRHQHLHRHGARTPTGRQASTKRHVNLPASASYTYDANGNLLSDGNRCFAYDDENQLVSVWVTNAWRSDFVYDGRMRRRQRSSTPGTSAWVKTSTVLLRL